MSKPADLLERIPDPQTIKARIADAVGEAALLRRMLRLSEQRERYQRVAAQRSPELAESVDSLSVAPASPSAPADDPHPGDA